MSNKIVDTRRPNHRRGICDRPGRSIFSNAEKRSFSADSPIKLVGGDTRIVVRSDSKRFDKSTPTKAKQQSSRAIDPNHFRGAHTPSKGISFGDALEINYRPRNLNSSLNQIADLQMQVDKLRLERDAFRKRAIKAETELTRKDAIIAELERQNDPAKNLCWKKIALTSQANLQAANMLNQRTIEQLLTETPNETAETMKNEIDLFQNSLYFASEIRLPVVAVEEYAYGKVDFLDRKAYDRGSCFELCKGLNGSGNILEIAMDNDAPGLILDSDGPKAADFDLLK